MTRNSITLFVFLASLCPASLFAAEIDACVDTSLALVNAQIHTMDENNSVASSVLIRAGRFVAINPDDEAFDECTKVVDLDQRIVIPGLIDNHVHYIRP